MCERCQATTVCDTTSGFLFLNNFFKNLWMIDWGYFWTKIKSFDWIKKKKEY
jgi:hypothetical protein